MPEKQSIKLEASPNPLQTEIDLGICKPISMPITDYVQDGAYDYAYDAVERLIPDSVLVSGLVVDGDVTFPSVITKSSAFLKLPFESKDNIEAVKSHKSPPKSGFVYRVSIRRSDDHEMHYFLNLDITDNFDSKKDEFLPNPKFNLEIK